MAQAEEILLVDDSSDDATLIVRAFKKHGVTNPVHVVNSGDEALAYLKSAADGTLPKLILLDGRMPGMDGFAVLEAIRANPAWNGLPVVMLTGSDTIHELDRAYEQGATAFIGKPSSPRDLDYVITEFRRRWLQ